MRSNILKKRSNPSYSSIVNRTYNLQPTTYNLPLWSFSRRRNFVRWWIFKWIFLGYDVRIFFRDQWQYWFFFGPYFRIIRVRYFRGYMFFLIHSKRFRVYTPNGKVSGTSLPCGSICRGNNALVSSIKMKASYRKGMIVGT
jgi:hypothetical protein